MFWIDRVAILAAINSAGDTLDLVEAQEIVNLHGGNPDWVINPPAWVDELNRRLRAFHGNEPTANPDEHVRDRRRS